MERDHILGVQLHTAILQLSLGNFCNGKHIALPGSVVGVGTAAVGVQLPHMCARFPESLLCAESHLPATKVRSIHLAFPSNIPHLVFRICSTLDGHDFASDTCSCVRIAQVHLDLIHKAVVVFIATFESCLRAYRQCDRKLRETSEDSHGIGRPSYRSSHAELMRPWIRMQCWLRMVIQ